MRKILYGFGGAATAADPIGDIEALFPAGTYHWLADDLAVGGVTAWADRLQSYDAGATSIIGPPVVQANGTTGRQEVTFDGVSHHMRNTAALSGMSQPFTTGVVLQASSTVGTDTAVGHAGNSGLCRVDRVSTNWGIRSSTALTDTGGLADTNYHFVAGVFNGASSEVWADGVQIHTGDAGASGYGGVSIGAAQTSLDWAGEIAAVFIAPGDISGDLLAISNLYRTYYNNQWSAA